tara:strand:+ start:51 stop:548 length:498 start_codon:yes stop_codon:yes gene_type:complete
MSRLVLSIISLPFLLVGVVALLSDFNSFILRAEINANDTRLQIGRVHQRALEIDKYLAVNGELPSNKQLACDWKPCPEHFFWLWNLIPSAGSNYKLEFLKIGSNPFGPLFKHVVIYDSTEKTTDHDWFQNKLSWYLYFIPSALLSLLVMFFPLIVFMLTKRFKNT